MSVLWVQYASAATSERVLGLLKSSLSRGILRHTELKFLFMQNTDYVFRELMRDFTGNERLPNLYTLLGQPLPFNRNTFELLTQLEDHRWLPFELRALLEDNNVNEWVRLSERHKFPFPNLRLNYARNGREARPFTVEFLKTLEKAVNIYADRNQVAEDFYVHWVRMHRVPSLKIVVKKEGDVCGMKRDEMLIELDKEEEVFAFLERQQVLFAVETLRNFKLEFERPPTGQFLENIVDFLIVNGRHLRSVESTEIQESDLWPRLQAQLEGRS